MHELSEVVGTMKWSDSDVVRIIVFLFFFSFLLIVRPQNS